MLYDYNKLIFFIQFLAECSLIHSSYDDFVILFSMERKKDDSFFLAVVLHVGCSIELFGNY